MALHEAAFTGFPEAIQFIFFFHISSCGIRSPSGPRDQKGQLGCLGSELEELEELHGGGKGCICCTARGPCSRAMGPRAAAAQWTTINGQSQSVSRPDQYVRVKRTNAIRRS